MRDGRGSVLPRLTGIVLSRRHPRIFLGDESNICTVAIDDVPWVTFALAAGMVVVYLVSPAITPLSYTLLAPWMHAGFGHIWQNLLVFIVLGVWVERQVDWLTYLFFAVMIPYLALYLPVVFEYGGLSRGASGLTMALTGYMVPVLLADLAERIESFEFDTKEVVVGLGILLVLVYLSVDSWVTVQRFVGLEPRPVGVSVSSHMTGLVLGVLWFGWRVLRHGLVDA
jgi:membrane associated rhomboid family serine protease